MGCVWCLIYSNETLMQGALERSQIPAQNLCLKLFCVGFTRLGMKSCQMCICIWGEWLTFKV